jgi:hypothetical protein
MAYGNWGGHVYRNGQRMEAWEDNTPYRETELTAGYAQAFLRDQGYDPHHAILGEKRVRLCGYKDSPILYVDGQQVDLAPYRTTDPDDWDENEGNGEIDGYRFNWSYDWGEQRLDLMLIEPDGTTWTGFGGYMIGAGFD